MPERSRQKPERAFWAGLRSVSASTAPRAIGHHALVPMGVEEFVGRLAATDPAAAAILRDHLADNEDELLLHPLVARIRDLAISSFDEGNLGLAAG